MKQILLIEDNQDHAELIERSLEKGLDRISIFRARSAQEARNYLSKKSVDLILCDYYLPDCRGEKLIRDLCHIAPSTPLVVVTGHGDEKTAARSIKAGAEDYVVKTRDALLALPGIIKTAIAKKESKRRKTKTPKPKNLSERDEAAERALDEMEKIEKKMRSLKKFLPKKSRIKNSGLDLFESLSYQVENLKKFLLGRVLRSK